MKTALSAERVVSARVSDTGDEINLLLRTATGDDTEVRLPLDQLGLLSALLAQAAAKVDPDAPAPARAPPVFPVEWWTVRPEPDEEHIVLGFRMGKGTQLSLRMHRSAAQAYVQALTSLLGKALPAAPSKARH
ncbi:MAG: hypothetical protein ACM31L_04665 [Actinomycetota bacterium]